MYTLHMSKQVVLVHGIAVLGVVDLIVCLALPFYLVTKSLRHAYARFGVGRHWWFNYPGLLLHNYSATMHKLPKFCFYQNNFLEGDIFMLFFALNDAFHDVCNGTFFMSMGHLWVYSWLSCTRRFVALPRL